MTPIVLRRLRHRLQLSQAGFAALVGVASNTVARWERGELGMRPTTARLIALLTEPVPGARRSRRKVPATR
jgi:DNA-binding transcriptional regulator YiaG